MWQVHSKVLHDSVQLLILNWMVVVKERMPRQVGAIEVKTSVAGLNVVAIQKRRQTIVK